MVNFIKEVVNFDYLYFIKPYNMLIERQVEMDITTEKTNRRSEGVKVPPKIQDAFITHFQAFTRQLHDRGGVPALRQYLIENGLLGDETLLSTFQDLFKIDRCKNGNGIFKHPELFDGIFSLSALFGGIKTSDNELADRYYKSGFKSGMEEQKKLQAKKGREKQTYKLLNMQELFLT